MYMKILGKLENIVDSFEDSDIGRRGFLSTALNTGIYLLFPLEIEAQRRRNTHQHIDYSKIPVPSVGYSQIVKEQNFSGISLSDQDTEIGRIQRSLRWRNIAQAVSKRYGVPSSYLLGMICIESEGDPTQPNDLGDGGVGLIHMQPLLAFRYGLDLITDSRRLRDFYQGKRLRRAIEATDGDLKDLIKIDERFHPIKNIDAAARMLCDLYESNGHTWRRALERYAGRGSYDSRVLNYSNKITSSNFMRGVRRDFGGKNRNVKISGKQITFDSYLSTFHNLNRNYGLDTYSKLRKHPVR